MDFPPKIGPALRKMDARIFDARPMNLATGLSAAPRRHPRLARLEP
jgi:acyl CoA:acetate/3-ketoacid CoA transferase